MLEYIRREENSRTSIEKFCETNFFFLFFLFVLHIMPVIRLCQPLGFSITPKEDFVR